MAASNPGTATQLASNAGGYEPAITKRVRRKDSWLWRLVHNTSALISALIILIVVLASVLVAVFSPHDPYLVDPLNRLQPPTADHWLGTDDLGRDVFTRLLYGARTSLLVGLTVMLVAAVIGTIVGLVAGYYSQIDGIIMRVMDAFMAFPSILLAIAIMAALGPNTVNVIIALSIVYTPRIARLIRGETLVNKEALYVESAKSIGVNDRTILSKYILLNSLSPLIVQCTFIIAYAITSEASLSFLGAGVPPEIPTWGNMLRDGQRLISRAWWLAISPGVALFMIVLVLNLVGDGLRDALDPRSRDR